MISRLSASMLVATAVAGCSFATPPTEQRTESAPTPSRTQEQAAPAPVHAAERIALQFIDSLQHDELLNDVAEIPADAELSRRDRIKAFRMLEEFAKTQEWKLSFTSIDVIDGKEDSVDCYLRGTDGGMLVLLLGYHYDVDQWQISAYEIPGRTFARPADESYQQYIARSISESKDGATPFKDGVDGDGRYFIDYRDGG